MDESPRPLLQQLGMIVAMLMAAIVAGIAIGWLLSPRTPTPISQSRDAVATNIVATQGATIPAMTLAAEPATAAPTMAATALPEPPSTPNTPPPATATSVPTAAPTSAPKTAPTTAPTSAPTVVPPTTVAPPTTAAPVPTAQDPAVALLQQVAVAEAALRSGEMDATLDYGEGTRAAAHLRFDFGSEQRLSRLNFKTTYQGGTDSRTIETVAVGDQAWERQGDQAWNAVPPRKGLWDQVQFFLPHAKSASNPQIAQQPQQIELRWYDAARDADVTLLVDPQTSIPRELRRQNRSSHLILTVIYRGWNSAVEIGPPV